MTKRPKLIVLDTMNFWMEHFLEDVIGALKEVDVLTINNEEARQLSGEYSLVKAAKKIQEMGPKYLVIKKGEHGALLFHEDVIFPSVGFSLESVVDPTGAGDSFAGAMIGHLAAKNKTSFSEIKKSIIYGNVMGSFAVEKYGLAGLTSLKKSDISKRIKQYEKMVMF